MYHYCGSRLRDSYECTNFLSDQAAWPTKTAKEMHQFVASSSLATYVCRVPETRAIHAAVVLSVSAVTVISCPECFFIIYTELLVLSLVLDLP